MKNLHRVMGILSLTRLAVPAFAQKDVAGEWGNRFDEDFLERIPGPDIGDYLAIPLNEAARRLTSDHYSGKQMAPSGIRRPVQRGNL